MKKMIALSISLSLIVSGMPLSSQEKHFLAPPGSIDVSEKNLSMEIFPSPSRNINERIKAFYSEIADILHRLYPERSEKEISQQVSRIKIRPQRWYDLIIYVYGIINKWFFGGIMTGLAVPSYFIPWVWISMPVVGALMVTGIAMYGLKKYRARVAWCRKGLIGHTIGLSPEFFDCDELMQEAIIAHELVHAISLDKNINNRGIPNALAIVRIMQKGYLTQHTIDTYLKEAQQFKTWWQYERAVNAFADISKEMRKGKISPETCEHEAQKFARLMATPMPSFILHTDPSAIDSTRFELDFKEPLTDGFESIYTYVYGALIGYSICQAAEQDIDQAYAIVRHMIEGDSFSQAVRREVSYWKEQRIGQFLLRMNAVYPELIGRHDTTLKDACQTVTEGITFAHFLSDLRLNLLDLIQEFSDYIDHLNEQVVFSDIVFGHNAQAILIVGPSYIGKTSLCRLLKKKDPYTFHEEDEIIVMTIGGDLYAVPNYAPGDRPHLRMGWGKRNKKAPSPAHLYPRKVTGIIVLTGSKDDTAWSMDTRPVPANFLKQVADISGIKPAILNGMNIDHLMMGRVSIPENSALVPYQEIADELHRFLSTGKAGSLGTIKRADVAARSL